MSTSVVVLMIIVAVTTIAATALLITRRRSRDLRSRFGPEYQRALEEHGSQRRAEAALEKRQRRMEKFHIRALTREDQERFAKSWRADQARFVDDPKEAVTEADLLVTQVMNARGYPMGDFEQRAADISVDHARVVDNYRRAHATAVRQQQGQATTEDLRKAIVFYRELFEELLEKPVVENAEARK